MKKTVAIIPARMASTRFPGKPLADIFGLPMIEHVRRRVALSKLFSKVVVATCDKEIYDTVKRFDGEAVMTADAHQRCTDRVAEAALTYPADVYVNVQVDEPLVDPDMFSALLVPLENESNLQCTNFMAEIKEDEEFNNPNGVKTVYDLNKDALYFSREPVPSALKAGKMKFKKYKQLGIYAFRSDFLQVFAKLAPTILEEIESVDMLRAIEHGYKVRMVENFSQNIGVDTPEDLQRTLTIMKKDKLFPLYKQ